MPKASSTKSGAVASLEQLALRALGQCMLESSCPAGGLARLSSQLSAALLESLVAMLCPSVSTAAQHDSGGGDADLLPPIELLRPFYGGNLEAHRQCGADDNWCSEALGGGLGRLASLVLYDARLTAYGMGHLRCALGGSLVELEVWRCRTLGPAGVAQLAGCPLLRVLRLCDCCALGIASAASAAPLLGGALPALEHLDLSGSSLGAEAAREVCADRSGRPLHTFQLQGSLADDDAAMAAMELPFLRSLDLSWTHVGVAGAQAVAMGRGDALRDLRLGHTVLGAGDVAGIVPAMPHLDAVSLDGLTLAAEDLEALARAPLLARCSLRDVRLSGASGRVLSAAGALAAAPSLRELFLDGATDSLPPPSHAVEAVHAAAARAAASMPPEADPAPGQRAPRTLSLCRCSAALLTALCPADEGARPLSPPRAWREAAVGLSTLRLSGCPEALGGGFPAVWRLCSGAGAAGPAGGTLRALELAGAGVTDARLHWLPAACPRLTRLDLSDNPAVSAAGLKPLVGLAPTLRVLLLRGCSGVTAHALPLLARLGRLTSLELEGTSIGPQDASSLQPLRRAVASRLAAQEALARFLRGAARGGSELAAASPRAGGGGGAAEVPGCAVASFSAEEFHALRKSSWASVPARPLPALPGIVRPVAAAEDNSQEDSR